VVPALLEAGLEEPCSSIIDFLTVLLVSPSVDAPKPITLQEQAGRLAYVHGPDTITYLREKVLYRDLTLLQTLPFAGPASYPDLLDVDRVVHDIVIEVRSNRNERADTGQTRTVRERLGTAIMDLLLLLCWADNDEVLSPLHHS
jgi:hypothetical protein